MVWLDGLRSRLNQARIELVQRARSILNRLADEIGRTIDLQAWRAESTVRGRLRAVSWPRAGVGAGVLAVLGGLMVFILADRPHAYPPPEPTAREIALRREAERLATVTPPPSLVEANKSWKAQ